MKNQSTHHLEHVWDQLATIKKVEPNGDLYKKVQLRIRANKLIPMFWIRAAACLLVCLVTAEIYFIFKTENTRAHYLSEIIYRPNNSLYND